MRRYTFEQRIQALYEHICLGFNNACRVNSARAMRDFQAAQEHVAGERVMRSTIRVYLPAYIARGVGYTFGRLTDARTHVPLPSQRASRTAS